VNQEQSRRLGQLLAMGVPLPIAYAIALDPEQAKAGAMAGAQSFVADPQAAFAQFEAVAPKKKKRVSAYNRKYKAAFKKVAPRYKLKNGKWKAGGFKRAVREAHKLAGGKKR
jgi:hypothetical protein